MDFFSVYSFEFLVMLIIALVVSCIGFYKYVYFISLGYGFSIAAFGIAMPILFRENLSIETIVTCILFAIYGCRLGGYLLIREIKSASYRNTMKKEIKDGSTMKLVAKVSIWVHVHCYMLFRFHLFFSAYRMVERQVLYLS